MHDLQVPALERWTNLETLVLDWCDLLNHLTLALPRLRKISLRHCKILTSVRPPSQQCTHPYSTEGHSCNELGR